MCSGPTMRLARVAAGAARRLELEVVPAPGLHANELARPGDPDALLGPLVGLHLRHAGLTLLLAPPRTVSRRRRPGRHAARAGACGERAPGAASPSVLRCSWTLGLWTEASVMNIDLPSSAGVRSTVPWSLTASPNLARRFRPISGWVSSRPRKRTVTLIRSPSSRNSIARWTFVSKSPDADLRREADFLELHRPLLALRLLLALGQLVLVLTVVEKLDDGGAAIGATSTRSRPRSCAIARAWCVGMTPSCEPSSSTTRTWGTRIIWLMRRSRLMAGSLCSEWC